MTQPAQASKSGRGMRVYRWPPQPPHTLEVVGVTSIIENGIPKPFLIGWAAKMTAQCAVDDHELIGAMLKKKGGERMALDHLKGSRYRDSGAKADRGTIVHSAVEAYLAGKPVSRDELEEQLAEKRVDRSMWKAAHGMVSGALEFLEEHQPEILSSEGTAYSRTHGYAGTPDLVVMMRVGRALRPVIVDFKTSKAIYDETSLQLCAYSRADFRGLNDGTEVPMPEGILDGIAVRLMASGRYEPVPFALTDDLFDVFLHAQGVALGKPIIEGARRPTF